MKRIAALIVGLMLALIPLSRIPASGWRKDSNEVYLANVKLHGKVFDHTANHGKDRRIYSSALGQRRDVYVYVPPGYDPHEKYPVIFFLHGFAQDEQVFLKVAQLIDEAIAKHHLPPVIAVAPDGTCTGEPALLKPATFFLNSRLGSFEDFVLQDVWDFVCRHYSICSEREAHVLAGASMGGMAAFNMGIRHRYAFGNVVGIFPPLNLRWMDDCGNYMANFNPARWGWRMEIERPREPVGRLGALTLPINRFVCPLFGGGDNPVADMSRENPIEILDRTGLKNGDLEMYIAYAGRDEFNIDAQVESFLYLCKHRGIAVGVGYAPEGDHSFRTAYQLWPGVVEWLAERLGPYCPESAHYHGHRRLKMAKAHGTSCK